MQKQPEEIKENEEVDFEEPFSPLLKKGKKTKRKIVLRELREIIQPNYGNEKLIVYH
jgi:hypothetical protein